MALARRPREVPDASALISDVTRKGTSATMAAALLVALLLVVLVAGCGGGGSSSGTGSGGTTGGGSTATEGGSPLAAGQRTFEATCSSCHTLAAAGATGEVGPNLDELEPSQALVEKQVTEGGGGMPAFGGTLSKEEIVGVAKFVSSSAGAS